MTYELTWVGIKEIMRKKATISVILTAILLSLIALSFAGCNNKDDYLSIYLNYNEAPEYSRAELICELPNQYTVYTTNNAYFNQYSEYGYIEELDGYILTKSSDQKAVLNFMDANQNLHFSEEDKIIQIRVRYGLMAVMNTKAEIGVYDPQSKTWIVPIGKNAYLKGSNSSDSISKYVKILSKKFIVSTAVAAKEYLQSQMTGTVNEYLYPIISVEKKAIIGRLKVASGSIDDVRGYDDFAVISGTNIKTSSGVKQVLIAKFNSSTANSLKEIVPDDSGVFTAKGSSSSDGIVYQYMGNGKFLIHIEQSGTESSHYYKMQEKEGGSFTYWNVYRYIYNGYSKTATPYNSKIIMLEIANQYNRYETNKVKTLTYLKRPYSYVGYALIVNEDRTVDYDQFIIDENFNIKMSLTRNFGMNFEYKNQVTDISYFDLMKRFVGGVGCVNTSTGIARLYASNGSVIAENKEHTYTSCVYNSGMMVATYKNPNNSSESFYCAIDTKGRIVTQYNYTKLSIFNGEYAIGERNATKSDGAEIEGKRLVVLVGKSGQETRLVTGNESNPIYNLRLDNQNRPIYKDGIYAYQYGSGDSMRFGLKNTNPNTNVNKVMDAEFTKLTIYTNSASFYDTYIIGEKANGNSFFLYRLR